MAHADEENDTDWPDAADVDSTDDDSLDTRPCPRCGHFITAEESALSRPRLWVIVVAIICIAMVVLLAMR